MNIARIFIAMIGLLLIGMDVGYATTVKRTRTEDTYTVKDDMVCDNLGVATMVVMLICMIWLAIQLGIIYFFG